GHRVTHHDVVEHVDVVVADLLDGLGQAHHALRPFAIRDARKLYGQLHDLLTVGPSTGGPSVDAQVLAQVHAALLELGRRSLDDDPAAVEHDDVVGHVEDQLGVLL